MFRIFPTTFFEEIGGGPPPMPAIAPITSSSLEGHHIMKSSAATLYSLSVTIGSTPGWLMLFNQTTNPADGAVTPARFWQVPSDGTQGQYDENFATAIALSTGCVLVFSTTGPLTKTESATALFSAQVA
jgi:hypothetical protein